MAETETGTYMTKAEAGNKQGHVWNEELQKFVPLGLAIMQEHLAKPLDLDQNLENFANMRTAVLKFVGSQMVEAEYGDKGWPVPGKLGDFYMLPSFDKKQLTKRGGSKLGTFFRFHAGPLETKQTTTKEYCDCTVSMTLLDQFGRTVGSAVSSCSTAEKAFQAPRAKQKYGGDMRAALNDITARARKRCYVQAIIIACCVDEIFEVATEHEDKTEARSELPTIMTIGKKRGQKLKDIDSDTLKRCAAHCAAHNKHDKLAEACLMILEDRRERNSDDGDPY